MLCFCVSWSARHLIIKAYSKTRHYELFSAPVFFFTCGRPKHVNDVKIGLHCVSAQFHARKFGKACDRHGVANSVLRSVQRRAAQFDCVDDFCKPRGLLWSVRLLPRPASKRQPLHQGIEIDAFNTIQGCTQWANLPLLFVIHSPEVSVRTLLYSQLNANRWTAIASTHLIRRISRASQKWVYMINKDSDLQ